MTLWKSPHPDLDIPEHLTTWQWAFEDPVYSAVARDSVRAKREAKRDGLSEPKNGLGSQDGLTCRSDGLGSYINALTSERLGFADVKLKAERLSTALVRRYGLKEGETVSLFCGNGVWYPVAMWAVVRVGGRVNGASPAYNVEEMAYALRTAGSSLVITLPNCLDVAVAAAQEVGLGRERVLLLEGEVEGFVSVQGLIEESAEGDMVPYWRMGTGRSNREVCGYLNFSSGTTGLPKAVMLSHHNIIAQCHQLRQLQVVASGERYRILAVMPLFHITGLVRFCHYPVFMNGDSIMLPAFTMDSMLKAIIKY